MNLINSPVNLGCSYLYKYYTEIKEGRIIAGQELITSLENLIEDLNNPKYVYDMAAGHLQINFIERFCTPLCSCLQLCAACHCGCHRCFSQSGFTDRAKTSFLSPHRCRGCSCFLSGLNHRSPPGLTAVFL